MITLQARLRAVGLTQTAVAKAVGIGDPHLSRIISGEIVPKVPLAKALEAASRGALPAAVLVGLEDLPGHQPPSPEAA